MHSKATSLGVLEPLADIRWARVVRTRSPEGKENTLDVAE